MSTDSSLQDPLSSCPIGKGTLQNQGSATGYAYAQVFPSAPLLLPLFAGQHPWLWSLSSDTTPYLPLIVLLSPEPQAEQLKS